MQFVHVGDDSIDDLESYQRQQQEQTTVLSSDDDEMNDNILDGPSSSSDESSVANVITLGGTVEIPAHALLLSITKREHRQHEVLKLPSILGREYNHNSSDGTSFIPLVGPSELLSEKHARIFYRDAYGGELYTNNNDNSEMTYLPPDNTRNSKRVISPGEKESSFQIPKGGFFALECINKNDVKVGGVKLKEDEVCILKNGTVLELGIYSFLFLLPIQSQFDNNTESTIQVPNPEYQKIGQENDNNDSTNNKKSKPRKRKSTDSSSITSPGSVRTFKSSIAAEYEGLSVDAMLVKFNEAYQSDLWERKHQILGSMITLVAVMDAASSKEILNLAIQDPNFGVARSEIMNWIANAPKYKDWVVLMKSKMEDKSYQSSIGKCLGRAGYSRVGSKGRLAKWKLPPNAEEKVKKLKVDLEKKRLEADSEEEREQLLLIQQQPQPPDQLNPENNNDGSYNSEDENESDMNEDEATEVLTSPSKTFSSSHQK